MRHTVTNYLLVTSFIVGMSDVMEPGRSPIMTLWLHIPMGVDPQKKVEGTSPHSRFPSPPLRSSPLISSYGSGGEL